MERVVYIYNRQPQMQGIYRNQALLLRLNLPVMSSADLCGYQHGRYFEYFLSPCTISVIRYSLIARSP